MAAGFYVTMIRGSRVAWLAGPFEQHEDAMLKIPAVREAAYEVDARTHFDFFGTARLERSTLPSGVLNGALGL